MKVVIDFEDGQYYLRHFREGHTIEAFTPPEEWLPRAVDVPDHVVVAYAAVIAQMMTMHTLLQHYDSDGER